MRICAIRIFIECFFSHFFFQIVLQNHRRIQPPDWFQWNIQSVAEDDASLRDEFRGSDERISMKSANRSEPIWKCWNWQPKRHLAKKVMKLSMLNTIHLVKTMKICRILTTNLIHVRHTCTSSTKDSTTANVAQRRLRLVFQMESTESALVKTRHAPAPWNRFKNATKKFTSDALIHTLASEFLFVFVVTKRL